MIDTAAYLSIGCPACYATADDGHLDIDVDGDLMDGLIIRRAEAHGAGNMDGGTVNLDIECALP